MPELRREHHKGVSALRTTIDHYQVKYFSLHVMGNHILVSEDDAVWSLIKQQTVPKQMLLVLRGVCAVKACPGVCVAERIADYCEAVLNVLDLCKPGLRCCVSRDSYGDGELPPNLVLMDRNGSRPTSGSFLLPLFCRLGYICGFNQQASPLKILISHLYE